MPIIVPTPAIPPLVGNGSSGGIGGGVIGGGGSAGSLGFGSTLSDIAFAALPEFVRHSDDGTIAALLHAIGATVQTSVDFLVKPGVQVDPALTPHDRLGWLSALAGVDTSAVPVASLRSWLADSDNYYRGNIETIVRRVGLTLTGGKSVTIACPYQGDPWRIYVGTLAAETPDPAATTAAIRAEVPAWLRLTADVALVGKTYDALAATYPTYDAMTATGKTYEQLSQEAP